MRTLAALRLEATRTAELVLPGFQANTPWDLEGFELALTPVLGLASPGQEGLGQEGLVADEVGAEDIVARLEFEFVEYVVAAAASEQVFAARLVGFALRFDIVGATSDYFARGYRVLELLLVEWKSCLRLQHRKLCNLLLWNLLLFKLIRYWLCN